jgi:stage V sporulation protein R
MFRDIEMRWNEGRFGREYDECQDLQLQSDWDRQLNLGRKKIFEVRQLHNDVTFLETFLTPELCERLKLFTFVFDGKNNAYEVRSRGFEQVKAKLLQTLTNGGNPIIEVVSGSPLGRGDLYLRHVHEGIDLKLDYARETLRNLQRIWHKPVHIETIVDDIPKIMTFDGHEHRERRIS